MNILEMTKEDFDEVPIANWNDEFKFDNVVIIPMNKLHDSGFRMMDFVLCKDEKPLCRFSAGSDVLHLDGIAGLGKERDFYAVKPKAWHIDCLPKSGYLRVLAQYPMENGYGLSDFEIFSVPKK